MDEPDAAVRPPRREEMVRLFPLTGTLLLPDTFLPLNIFEPRYLAMVEDAVDDDGRIGMIQPRVPAADNAGPVPDGPERPELYEVGCLGEMTRCERQPDGRFHIVLRGLQRFRIRSEAADLRGYRRAVADLGEFAADRQESELALDVNRVLAASLSLTEKLDLSFDEDLLAALPAVTLVNALSISLPFTPVERQALLESPDAAAREALLYDLIGMMLRSDVVDERPTGVRRRGASLPADGTPSVH